MANLKENIEFMGENEHDINNHNNYTVLLSHPLHLKYA